MTDAPQDWPRAIADMLSREPRDPNKPTVLCLTRPQFQRDALELARRAQRYNFLGIDTHAYSKMQWDWMPQELMQQYHYHQHREPQHEAAWQKCEDFAAQVLELLAREINLVAVMSANFDYWGDEGLRRAGRKLGIPFVALHRECGVCDFGLSHFEEHYGNYTLKPNIAALAVGAETMVGPIVRHGVLPADLVHVTGFPRFDPWQDPAINEAERNTIVLVSYSHWSYFNDFGGMLNAFVDAAAEARSTNVKFHVKTKTMTEKNEIREALKGRIGENFSVGAEPMHQALRQAKAVFGSNSLAFIEALLAPASLYIPQWGEALQRQPDQSYWHANPEHAKHFTFITDQEDAKGYVLGAVYDEWQRPDDTAGRLKLAQQYVHFVPGQPATAAIEDVIDLSRTRWPKQAG